MTKQNPTIERVRTKYNEVYKIAPVNENESALFYWPVKRWINAEC